MNLLQLQSAKAQVKFPTDSKLDTIRISDEEYIVRYKKKKVLKEYTFKGNVLNGLFQYQDNEPDYKFKHAGYYLEGLRTGKWVTIRETPKYIRTEEFQYVKDTLHGKNIIYFTDKTDGNKLYSVENEYFKGNLKSSADIWLSDKHGVCTRYYFSRRHPQLDSTVIDSIINYREKELIYKTLEIDTINYSKKYFRKLKKQGWYRNKQLAFIEKFINGQAVDTARFYHANGQLKEEIYFNKYGPHGMIKSYYDNGNIHEERYCWNGYQDSFAKVYWPNGEIKKEAKIFLNRISGPYTEYFDIVYGDYRPTKKLNLFYYDSILNCGTGGIYEWDSAGNLIKKTLMDGYICRGIYFNYYPNGNLHFEFNDETKKRNYYHPNGRKAMEIKSNYKFSYWSPNGRKISLRKYLRKYKVPEEDPLQPMYAANEVYETDWSNKYKSTNETYIYDTVQIMPAVEMSRDEIIKYLQSYPLIKEWMKLQNTSEVEVELIVSEKGKIKNTTRNSDRSYLQGWDKINVNLFSVLSCLKWNPGTHRGNVVNVKAKFKIPIK